MTSAHLGARKLTYSIFAYVWLPKLHTSVSISFLHIIFTRNHRFCILAHRSAAPIANFHIKINFLDFITDFPLSQGYNAIFVYVDHLINYTKLFPCFMGGYLLIVVEGFLAIILSQAVWKRSWAEGNPTQSKMAADRSVSTTGIAAWAQLLTTLTTGPNHDINHRPLMTLISVQASWRLSTP